MRPVSRPYLAGFTCVLVVLMPNVNEISDPADALNAYGEFFVYGFAALCRFKNGTAPLPFRMALLKAIDPLTEPEAGAFKMDRKGCRTFGNRL